jgi:hypothetical protein
VPLRASSQPSDYVSAALARAVETRHRGADVDGALGLYVRRARAADVPLEEMLDALWALLRGAAPGGARDDAAELTALLMRRAVTEYCR